MDKKEWQTDENYAASMLIYVLYLLGIQSAARVKINGMQVQNYITRVKCLNQDPS